MLIVILWGRKETSGVEFLYNGCLTTPFASVWERLLQTMLVCRRDGMLGNVESSWVPMRGGHDWYLNSHTMRDSKLSYYIGMKREMSSG